MKLVIIDHYDSFTHNIAAWLRNTAPQLPVVIVPYDDHRAMSALQHAPCPLVLSAGPHSPRAAQPTLDLLAACRGRVAILGICLGFQIICVSLGLALRHSRKPLHGKLRRVFKHSASTLLADLPASFTVAAYNSLAVPKPAAMPAQWLASAVSDEDELQAIESQGNPSICGLQFHPESFLDQHSKPLLQRWLQLAFTG